MTLPTALSLGRHRATQNAGGLGGDVHGSVGAAFAPRWAEFIPPADEAGSAQHPQQSPSPFPGNPACGVALQFLDPGAFPGVFLTGAPGQHLGQFLRVGFWRGVMRGRGSMVECGCAGGDAVMGVEWHGG